MTTNHHESPPNADSTRKASNRSVGLVIAVVFGLIGAWPLFGGDPPRTLALAIACGLILLALVLPRALTPVTWLWMGLGQIMHYLVSPAVLGLVYLIAVIPTGLYVRVTKKDPLRLKLDPNAKTYWIDRDPPGPEPKSLQQQF